MLHMRPIGLQLINRPPPTAPKSAQIDRKQSQTKKRSHRYSKNTYQKYLLKYQIKTCLKVVGWPSLTTKMGQSALLQSSTLEHQ